MQNVAEKVKTFLTKIGCKFVYDANKMIFNFQFQGVNSFFSVYIYTAKEQKAMVSDVLCPLRIQPQRIRAIAELIGSINPCLEIGNLILRDDASILVSRIIVNVDEYYIDDKLLEVVIFRNIHTVDYLMPIIASVLYTDIEPSEALAVLEGDEEADEEPGSEAEVEEMEEKEVDDEEVEEENAVAEAAE